MYFVKSIFPVDEVRLARKAMHMVLLFYFPTDFAFRKLLIRIIKQQLLFRLSEIARLVLVLFHCIYNYISMSTYYDHYVSFNEKSGSIVSIKIVKKS